MKLTDEDIAGYMPHFDRFDMTYDQKVEYIKTLWKFMGHFAYRAFGMDSTQLAMEEAERSRKRKTAKEQPR